MSATSTPPTKKTPAAPSDKQRPPPASNPTPSRSPSRLAQTPSTMSSTTNAANNRTRSVRNGAGTPVSARAAARKPASANEAEEDAKAELQARLDELQERLHQAELASEESRKHADVLQIKLDEALKEQGILEESVHEHTERIEELQVERRESLRARRELEQIYEAEKVQSIREREMAATEKEELTQNLQRLKESWAQKELRDRTGVDDERRPSVSRASSLRSEDASPKQESRIDRQFAPSPGLQRSDSRSNSRVVLQKDKVIEQLRLELADAHVKLVELENKGGGTLHQLEKDMYDVKMQNARLMEENESFQMLLAEKTLNGDLAQSELLRPPSHSDSYSRPSSSARQKPRHSLADELEDVEGESETLTSEGSTDRTRVLQTEINNLKDQNKALTLYINNIISRLLEHDAFEAILDKSNKNAGLMPPQGAEVNTEKELPPPPPPPRATSDDGQQQPQGFLQRAGSVLRRKPARPVSQIQPADAPPRPSLDQSLESTVHQDPLTAPSIPFTRNAPARAGGHRRTRSDWPAANVVTNMYKGPSPASSGPLSPGLAGRTSYFTQRIPSTGAVQPPTPTELDHNKENQAAPPLLPHRDSKVSPLAASPERISTSHSSNRNSITSNPGDHPIDFPAESSNPSSPPRSTTSSGDRDARPSGAIMMGSRPRPLRLVQEADEEKARKQANRASWFGGWAQGATSSFGSFLPGRAGSGDVQGQGQQQQ